MAHNLLLVAVLFGFQVFKPWAALLNPTKMEKWKAVKDELPPSKEGWNHSELCLVWATGKDAPTIAYHHKKPPFEEFPCWVEWSEWRPKLKNVMYWMPLPDRPEGL